MDHLCNDTIVHVFSFLRYEDLLPYGKERLSKHIYSCFLASRTKKEKGIRLP